ncbi:hypothetical protein BDZ97DRAFT_1916270 [Flammula alnicola]|nr:hypothetical protein BDZ97DRAFT_1916270 [Flammula alnicola]
MTTPIPVIPLDVVGAIFDILATDNDKREEEFTSLKARALTCHAFLPLCRKHIFASITINGPSLPFTDPPPGTNALRKLLDTTPEIAFHVRKLRFGIKYENEQCFIGLPDIFKRLTRLKSLTLFGCPPGHDWNGMTLPMEDALLCLMNLPALTSLELIWIENFPISALIPCTQLRHFRIAARDIAEIDGSPPAILPVTPIRLEGYDFGFKSATVTKKILEAKRSDGQPIFDLTNLKQFSGHCETREDMNVALSIMRRSHHLTMIHLKFDEQFSFFGFAGMIASSINTLKKLRLETRIDDEHVDPLSGLCDELETMAGKNVLESLEICVNVELDTYCKTGDEWGRLDKILGKSGWSALKRVSLDITIWSYARPEDDDLVRILGTLPQRQFPSLSSSKAIDFAFDVKEDCP